MTASAEARQRTDLRADVTIIGAGLSGLIAGALLARSGYQVRILERDIHPGGCAARFERQHRLGRFRFAVGATLGTGLEPGGVLHQIYQQLGITRRVPSLDPVMRVHLNGAPVLLSGTRQGWRQELARAFPGERQQKQRFWQEIQSLADTMHHIARHFPSLPLRSLQDYLDTARGAHPGFIKLLASLNRSVGSLLEHHGLTDPAHRALIDGQLLDSMQATSATCALPSGAYALEVYRYGAQYVPGGLATLAEDLAGVIEAHGGQIHYATRARRILTETCGVRGVETHNRNFLSPVVISTAPVPDTVALSDDQRLEPLEQRFAAMPEPWGAFTLYIGVNNAVLPKTAQLFEQVTDYNADGLLENFLVSLSHPSDETRAPRGYRSLTVSTHVRAAAWFGLSETQYRQQKRALEQHLLERLERLFPGFGSGIVLLESGSPRSFQRFVLHGFGWVGGIPQTPDAAAFRAIHHTTAVPGLLLAGETVFPGQGIPGVAVSGYNSQRSARRYLRRHHPPEIVQERSYQPTTAEGTEPRSLGGI